MRRLIFLACVSLAAVSGSAQAPRQPDWAALEDETLRHFQAMLRLDTTDPRMALGARPADVLGLTIGQGLVPVAAGLVIGLAGCVAVGRLIQSQLYGVSAFDPLTLAGSCAGLATGAAVACYLPARRAARLDPVVTLHAE